MRKPARDVVTFPEILSFARKLPGVEQGTSYGTPAIKVRGKILVRLKEDRETVVLRCDFLDRQILVQADPEAFFYTDHYRDYPLVLVRLAKVDRAALPDLLERAWRAMAPKTLVAEYEARAKT